MQKAMHAEHADNSELNEPLGRALAVHSLWSIRSEWGYWTSSMRTLWHMTSVPPACRLLLVCRPKPKASTWKSVSDKAARTKGRVGVAERK
jgi:hypothetical protein